jgi:hypothetical protein
MKVYTPRMTDSVRKSTLYTPKMRRFEIGLSMRRLNIVRRRSSFADRSKRPRTRRSDRMGLYRLN